MHKANRTFVILTPGFPSSEADTVCLPALQHFVRGLHDVDPGLNIFILTFQYPYRTSTYQWHGATVMSFGGRNREGFYRWHLRRRIDRALRQIHDQSNLTGLLSLWYGECAWVGKTFAERHNVKHFCWIRGQDALPVNKYPRRLPPGGHELIALSDALQDEFERNHRVRPVHVINPGINDACFTRSAGRTIDLMAAGSLIPLKQFDHFIGIVAAIKRSMPSIRALLAGEGRERKRLERMIADHHLENNLQLLGERPYPEVLALMQQSKIFLHPSSYEGFSGVCLEAIAAGAAVVSYHQPMKYPVNNWHIVRDANDMQAKTLEILHNPGAITPTPNPFPIRDTVSRVMNLF